MSFLGLQLPATFSSQAIELRAPARVRYSPLGFNPSALLQPMQRGIKRALLQRETIVGNHRDAFGDIPAVQRFGNKSSQDEKIEGSLEKFISYLVHACNLIVMLLQWQALFVEARQQAFLIAKTFPYPDEVPNGFRLQISRRRADSFESEKNPESDRPRRWREIV